MVSKIINRLSALVVLWMLVATWSYAEAISRISERAALAKESLIRVNIHQLVVDPANQQPVVSLSDPDEKRALLIWIGISEAQAIYAELQGIEHNRPLTHDLLARIINKVNGKINRVVITHTEENIFYAVIVLSKNGNVVEIDARPSDSIVMALKFKAPIFVSRALFEKMSVPMQAPAGIEKEYGLTLQELTPELARYLAFESNTGVMVSDVQKGSRADKDGIERGDIIVKVGNEPTASAAGLKDILAKSQSPVAAKVFRKSRFLTITLHLR